MYLQVRKNSKAMFTQDYSLTQKVVDYNFSLESYAVS